MITKIEKRPLVIAFLAAFLAAGSVRAQTELPPTFEFSFSNPGARSMGFGGAFAALADDATAAFANPAGLVQLVSPEISIEGRYWSYSTPYVSGGRIWGPPAGIGMDSTAGLRTSSSDRDLKGLSFLSFVYPKDAGPLLSIVTLSPTTSSKARWTVFTAAPGRRRVPYGVSSHIRRWSIFKSSATRWRAPTQ
jgi:hypothetical protein